MSINDLFSTLKAGRGFYGHAGRPGKRGGSTSRIYSVSGNSKFPSNILNNKSSVLITLSKKNNLYAVENDSGSLTHADIRAEDLNYNYDESVRAEFYKGQIKFSTDRAGIGQINPYSVEADEVAEKQIKRLSRALVKAGFPLDTETTWFSSQGFTTGTPLSSWI